MIDCGREQESRKRDKNCSNTHTHSASSAASLIHPHSLPDPVCLAPFLILSFRLLSLSSDYFLLLRQSLPSIILLASSLIIVHHRSFTLSPLHSVHPHHHHHHHLLVIHCHPPFLFFPFSAHLSFNSLSPFSTLDGEREAEALLHVHDLILFGLTWSLRANQGKQITQQLTDTKQPHTHSQAHFSLLLLSFVHSFPCLREQPASRRSRARLHYTQVFPCTHALITSSHAHAHTSTREALVTRASPCGPDACVCVSLLPLRLCP